MRYVRKNYENDPKPASHYVSLILAYWNTKLLRLTFLQIDTVPAGAVLFISAPNKMINACYGGLMSTRAQHVGAAGTIIDGRLRDLQEHRDLDFPVRVFISSQKVTTDLHGRCSQKMSAPLHLQK